MITEEMFVNNCALTIPLCIMTITLNIFIIKFYRKSELTIVPLLYTLIASLDIVCAIGVIYKYLAILVKPSDIHAMIFYFLIQVSYRCSVFCNLVLAVTRTIMILNPFYQINLKMVKLACILYAVPWIVLNGVNIHELSDRYYTRIFEHGFLIGEGLSRKIIHLVNEDVFSNLYFIIWIQPDLIAFIVPVIIVIITCIIQVISVRKSSQFPNSSNQRHVTITVLLMSSLFVVCNSVHSGYLATLTAAILTGDSDLWNALITGNTFGVIFMLSASVFPMLNAALNPVIIITRSSGLRRSFLDFLRRMQRWVRER